MTCQNLAVCFGPVLLSPRAERWGRGERGEGAAAEATPLPGAGQRHGLQEAHRGLTLPPAALASGSDRGEEEPGLGVPQATEAGNFGVAERCTAAVAGGCAITGAVPSPGSVPSPGAVPPPGPCRYCRRAPCSCHCRARRWCAGAGPAECQTLPGTVTPGTGAAAGGASCARGRSPARKAEAEAAVGATEGG
eukprot:gi/632990853/ref/XP_007884360.1/ PREDICTED: protein SOGA3-like [Callorhinchus milii]